MATKRKLENEIKLVLNSKLIGSTTNKSIKLDLYSIKQNTFEVIDKPVQISTAVTKCVSKGSIHKDLYTEKLLDGILDREKNKSCTEIKSFDKCTTCSLKKFKYKCPGCEARSCSIDCVKHHKKVTKCTGKKRPFETIFLRSDITEKSCSTDYKFLQKGTHMITSVGTMPHTKLVLKKFDLHQSENIQLALQLDNVKWKPMSSNFTRHKNNKTCFHKSKQVIKWHVEWNFNCGKIKKQLTKPCDFTDTLEDLVKPFIDVKSLSYDYNLERYRKCSMKENSKLHFFLCNEEVSALGCRFKKLEGVQSVNKNLNGSIIIEYPRIHVVLDSDLLKYISNNQDIDISLS